LKRPHRPSPVLEDRSCAQQPSPRPSGCSSSRNSLTSSSDVGVGWSCPSRHMAPQVRRVVSCSHSPHDVSSQGRPYRKSHTVASRTTTTLVSDLSGVTTAYAQV